MISPARVWARRSVVSTACPAPIAPYSCISAKLTPTAVQEVAAVRKKSPASTLTEVRAETKGGSRLI
jgi:hypothetical protein